MEAVTERFRKEVKAALGKTGLVLVRTVGVGQPGDLCIARPEGGLSHAQRIKKALLQKLLVRQAADDFDQARGDIHALVAILILFARLPLKGTRHGTEGAVLEWRAVRARHLLKL